MRITSKLQTSKEHAKETDKTEEEDMVKFGIFYKKKAELDNKKVHMDIYSRRNMYSSIDRDVKTADQMEIEREKEEQRADWLAKQQELQEEEKRLEDERIQRELLAKQEEKEENESEDHTSQETQSPKPGQFDIRARIRQIAGAQEPTVMEKREAKIRMYNSNGPLLKDVLQRAAKKHSKKRTESAPIEFRIQNFFTKMDDMKQQEDDDGTMTAEQYRNWILLTKGAEAVMKMEDDLMDKFSHVSKKEHTF